MSGIFALTASVDASRLSAALARLAWLGGESHRVWSDTETVVSVTRKSWEAGADHSGPILVLDKPDHVVVADASLYDRPGLTRALAAAGVTPDGFTPTELIEAAYRAWGPALAEHLVGDFAFVIWDRRLRRLLAARDPLGMRPLYWSRLGDRVAVASSSRALADLTGRSGQLNLASLGSQVAGLIWSSGTDTAFEGVDPVPAANRLIWEKGRLRVERFWSPPSAPDSRPTDGAEAAEELRALLGKAVTERLGSGTTSVWMSGGWDSTAVFAAGQHALPESERPRLRPVSISYPEGDPGREDEMIQAVGNRWNADIHWIRSDRIPLLDGLEERAALTDEPPNHLYELWNRELARGSRSVGARIALDGCGGDNLFQVSDIILADLLRSGRLLEFARRARSRRTFGWKHLARAGVLPLLPDSLIRAGERVAGRRIPRHYMEHGPASWLRSEFYKDQDLRDRALTTLRAAGGESLAQRENILYVTAPAWGWAGGYMRGVLLQDGVEARSPLLDIRVVDFALRRPVAERADWAETKILLRRAMSGLLPASVLAPRPRRTGTTAEFSRRQMRQAYPALLTRLFGEPLRLAELGIVEPAALRAAADQWSERGDETNRVRLFDAMRVEFWLRGLDRGMGAAGTPPPASRERLEVSVA